jgi:hypothetical protein
MRAFEKNRRNEPTPAIPPHAPSNFLPDAFRYRVLACNGHANRNRVRIVRRFHAALEFPRDHRCPCPGAPERLECTDISIAAASSCSASPTCDDRHCTQVTTRNHHTPQSVEWPPAIASMIIATPHRALDADNGRIASPARQHLFVRKLKSESE